MTHLQNLLNQIQASDFYLLALSGIITLILVFLLYQFYGIKKPTAANDVPAKPGSNIITSKDIKAIAGDDVMSTQLDMARAYIEMDKKQFAKKILDHVLQHGDDQQQHEARQLISSLELS